jgi:hypothetical protein
MWPSSSVLDEEINSNKYNYIQGENKSGLKSGTPLTIKFRIFLPSCLPSRIKYGLQRYKPTCLWVTDFSFLQREYYIQIKGMWEQSATECHGWVLSIPAELLLVSSSWVQISAQRPVFNCLHAFPNPLQAHACIVPWIRPPPPPPPLSFTYLPIHLSLFTESCKTI